MRLFWNFAPTKIFLDAYVTTAMSLRYYAKHQFIRSQNFKKYKNSIVSYSIILISLYWFHIELAGQHYITRLFSL